MLFEALAEVHTDSPRVGGEHMQPYLYITTTASPCGSNGRVVIVSSSPHIIIITYSPNRPLPPPKYVLSVFYLSLIHISEPTRLLSISYAVFCLKKKKKTKNTTSMSL
eukprot:TRINITY_DN10136_c0_g1_i1.p1 TRINITY_DN10136_c0_g1~~TRINITY_DN10136_c0_g1_i1.p1  ORF type:complete len:108 (-),score=28.43 TRINITY_DN10136_c0_g1_i1:91-414(-)